MVSALWYSGIINTVAIHSILKPQTQTKETIMGVMECPVPLRAPTITSMEPHRK